MLFKTIQITLFSALAFAAPIASNNIILPRVAAIDLINGIAPDALTTCAGAEFPDECATADHAARSIADAINGQEFQAGEAAAIIALIAYETAEFKYNIHHFPHLEPGQGTRNMQHANFNLQYARSIPELAADLAKITTATTADGLTDVQKNQIMDLVADDKYTWKSAGWYMKTYCPNVRAGLAAGSDAAWEEYMLCVGTTSDEKRLPFWIRAKKTLGVGV
ncbi:hypothetical protein OCU04_009462 [Sclerotinia nivalis]|uniref:Uncharacterized protein n=1 Tax=Sclerotinia nivalis TaxID=352851 RepID=A0A9X0AF74_9HELO|nr:hypothetical protein OCU04_009462 [Sclerotinia nivalis]